MSDAALPPDLVRESGLLSPGERVLAAVSGGGDSLALLLALQAGGWPVTACCVDHGVRPESAAEAATVRRWGAARGIPVEVRSVSTTRHDEASLREARYTALAAAARGAGLRVVATGHTLDDQAETVVLRLQRGTGLEGLGGIPPSRRLAPGLRVVRPFLRARRADLRRWLTGQGQAWLEDPGNREPRYARSRLRLEGLPLAPELLATVSDAARAASARLAAAAADTLAEATRPDGTLDLDPLLRVPPGVARRVLTAAAGGALCQVHVDALARLASARAGSAELHLPGGRIARREYATLRFEAGSAPGGPSLSDTPVTCPGRVRLPETGMDLSFSVVPRDALPVAVPGPEEAWFDAEEVHFPLAVRSRRPGDRILPRGAPGSRKVSDVLGEARVPRRLRDGVPLVVAGGVVLWVAGVVRSAGAPVSKGTRRVLRMRLSPPRNKGVYVVSPPGRC